MTDKINIDEDEELLRGKLNSETAKIPWSQLQRFFAAGQTLSVAADLDLVDVAFVFSQDNAEQVKCWLRRELVFPVTDAQARDLLNRDSVLWAVVVKPWVLVQMPR
jgi:hypothetical protein